MKDEFGGVSVDEFGGVAVAAHDEFGGVPVQAAPDLSKINDPYAVAQLEHPEARGVFKPDPQQAVEMIRGLKELPGAAAGYIGNVARAIPADVAQTVAGQEKYFELQNLAGAALGETPQIDEQLRLASSESPAAAYAGKLSQGAAAMAPLALVGMPAGLVGRLVSLGFAGDMAASGGQAAGTLAGQMDLPPEQRNPDIITSALSDLTLSGFAPFAAAHGMKPSARAKLIGELSRNLLNDPVRYPVERPAAPGIEPQAEPAGAAPGFQADGWKSNLPDEFGGVPEPAATTDLPPSSPPAPSENVAPAPKGDVTESEPTTEDEETVDVKQKLSGDVIRAYEQQLSDEHGKPVSISQSADGSLVAKIGKGRNAEYKNVPLPESSQPTPALTENVPAATASTAVPPGQSSRPIPTVEEAKAAGAPAGVIGAIHEWETNQKIIETGIGADGKKATKAHIAELKARQPQVVANYHAELNSPAGPTQVASEETIAHELLTKKNVTPLVDFRLGRTPDGKWTYTFQLNTSMNGYGVPHRGVFDTRLEAVKAGIADARGWVEQAEKRNNIPKEDKARYLKIRSTLANLDVKESKANAQQVTPAAKGKGPEKIDKQEVIDRYTAGIAEREQALKTGKFANGAPVTKIASERLKHDIKTMQSVIDTFKVQLAHEKPATAAITIPTVPWHQPFEHQGKVYRVDGYDHSRRKKDGSEPFIISVLRADKHGDAIKKLTFKSREDAENKMGFKLEDSYQVAPPLETAPAAAAKVEQHVEAVAKGEKAAKPEPALDRTTGPRAAKEIKSELVSRIEAEIAKLPPRPELLYGKVERVQGKRQFYVFSPDKTVRFKVREGLNDTWTIEDEKLSGKTGMLERTKMGTAYGNVAAATRTAASKMEQFLIPGDGSNDKVTIDIPGDGKFTIDRTHEALNQVLKRAQALDTRSTVPAQKSGPPGEPKIPDTDELRRNGQGWLARGERLADEIRTGTVPGDAPALAWVRGAGKNHRDWQDIERLTAIGAGHNFTLREVANYWKQKGQNILKHADQWDTINKPVETGAADMAAHRANLLAKAKAYDAKQKGAKITDVTPPGFGPSGEMADPAMGAPVPPIPPPTPKPGTTMVMDGRLPVTLDRTGPGSVSVPEIMDAFRNVLKVAGTDAGNIRVGRFGQMARGVWKPHQEIIRLNEADNIPTATHEVGHGLQQMVYGTAYAKGLDFLSGPIKRELIGMGKALYGSRIPVAGYTGEGFAEFMRYWLTTDDAATVAPLMTKFFEQAFLPAHPDVAAALKAARAKVDTYRMQGAVERANRQVMREPGNFKRVMMALAKFVGYQSQFESGAPIEAVSQAAARKLGRPLKPSEDPFKIFSWKRGSAGATVERMATDKMLDVWGNPTGPSLADALAPVRGQRQEFLLYLFARRAIERWANNKNPGITLADAQHIKGLYDKPEFQLAAQNYYNWWDGVLKYVTQADPTMIDVVNRIKQGSSDYAPLARMIDPQKARSAAATANSNPFKRMGGSGLPVKDIFDQTFIGAAQLINKANRAMVTRRIIQLAQIPGLGHIIEEVPRAKVAESVNIERIRQQLENMGVDTTAVPPDEMMTYFTLADRPVGSDPIVPYTDAMGTTKWYHVDHRLYDQLEALQTYSLKQSFPGIPHLGTVLDLVLGAPSRAFRLGTTGLRPAFSLVTNPVRDLQTLLAQTSSNPAKVAAMYPGALAEAVKGGPFKDAFFNLGAHLGQPLGQDIGHTQRVSKQIFNGRVMRVVTNPIDHLRELLSITESAPRIAELKAVADDIGWKPGTALTPDQAVQLALAAKRVTVDFSAAGDISRILNQAIPFYNPGLQGLRSFARAVRDNPQRAALIGATMFTAPALALWWQNKDKEWYKALPWREKYFYNHLDDGKNVWQIPRAFEWGNVFQVVPEAVLDSWYRHDPRAAKEALSYIFDTTNPVDYPVMLKLAKEQWSNRVDFWDRPIVPQSEVGLPPDQQVGPYTSKLAVDISKVFPSLSPRRVDAAIRSYFGGVGSDIMDMVGLGAQKRNRDWEASDFPVFGTLFRRGGEFSAQNQQINDFWDAYLPAKAQVDAFNFHKMQLATGGGNQVPVKLPTANTMAAAKVGEDIAKAVRLLVNMAAQTADTKARAELYRKAGELAARGTAIIQTAGKAK